MRTHVRFYTHVQYERSITSGLEVMAKVKVFVHATDADADADGRAMTLAPRTYLSRLAKNGKILILKDFVVHINMHKKIDIYVYFAESSLAHAVSWRPPSLLPFQCAP